MSDESAPPDWTRTAVAIVIGLASVVSAVFTWRAASLGADATFQDRTASTQEVLNQRFEAAVDLRMRAIDEGHVRYLGLETLLTEYDRQVETIAENGGEISFTIDEGRRALQEAAQEIAATAEVFGEEPDPFALDAEFDREARRRAVRLEIQNRPGAPVLGDPDISAQRADALRARALALTRWTVALVAVIVLLTLAEVTRRRRLRIVLGAAGSVAVTAIAVIAVLGDFT